MSLSSSPNHAQVARSLSCRWCGYDLRGLSTGGRCPECGARVWDTVIRALDPDAARLPQLRNPAAVGDGLLWLMVLSLLAMSASIAREITSWLHQFGWLQGRQVLSWLPHWLDMLAGVFGLIAMVSILMLKPPRGKEEPGPVRRDLRLLGIGIAAWSVISIVMGLWTTKNTDLALLLRLLASIAAILAMYGARGILGIIGQRSREYRTSRGGRQGLEAMIAAIGAAAVGSVLRHLAENAILPKPAITMGDMIVWMSIGLAFVGMVYLVINAWWIRRALRQPAPSIDELLIPGCPDDPEQE